MTKRDVQRQLHERLTALAEHRGEACPSFETIDEKLRDFEYKLVERWLREAPEVNSPEYARMWNDCVSTAVNEAMKSIPLPKRHATREIHHRNTAWNAGFKKVCTLLVESPDTMLALLGTRGTGKTQMAVEVIHFMLRHWAESAMKPAQLERWAWLNMGVSLGKRCALYSNTIDFFLEMRETYKLSVKENDNDVLQRFASPRLLILDEVHDRRETDWENSMFTYLINDRYQSACQQTIFIANQTPAEFETSVGSSIADRLYECGGVIDCNWASFRA